MIVLGVSETISRTEWARHLTNGTLIIYWYFAHGLSGTIIADITG